MTTEQTESILDAPAAIPGSYPTHSLTNREVFRAGYREAMFWANSFGGEGDDYWQGTDSPDFYDSEATAELTAALNEQADDFLQPEAVELIAAAIADPMASYSDFGQAGHDFALTRNHHGAGFWDRGINQGGELTDLAHAEGGATIYVGDPDKPETWTLEG